MAEPRFKKDMEDGPKERKIHECCGPKEKRPTKYLRLGYKSEPRKRKNTTNKKNKKKSQKECPGGKPNCGNCKDANVISPENLVKEQSGAEAITPLFKSLNSQKEAVRCCGEPGNGCCCGEE